MQWLAVVLPQQFYLFSHYTAVIWFVSLSPLHPSPDVPVVQLTWPGLCHPADSKSQVKESSHSLTHVCNWTHLLLDRYLLRGPADAISITSIRLSELQRPSMRTMNGLSSWYMISASLIISSFTSFSFSFFSTLTATSTWPLKYTPLDDYTAQGTAGSSECTKTLSLVSPSCQLLRVSLEDSLLDTAKVPRAQLHLVHQQLRPLYVKSLHIVGVMVRVEYVAVHG